jgi:hypothetical protein
VASPRAATGGRRGGQTTDRTQRAGGKASAEQRTRSLIRRINPFGQWKLSPADIASLDRWDDYTSAKEAMFEKADTAWVPWTPSRATTRNAPVSAPCGVLSPFDYPDRDPFALVPPDSLIVGRASEVYEHGERPRDRHSIQPAIHGERRSGAGAGRFGGDRRFGLAPIRSHGRR